MKLRKLVPFMLLLSLSISVTGIKAFAAENDNPTTIETNNTDNSSMNVAPGGPSMDLQSIEAKLQEAENTDDSTNTKEDSNTPSTENKKEQSNVKESKTTKETAKKAAAKKAAAKTTKKTTEKKAKAKTTAVKTIAKKAAYSASDLKYLSSIIYCEAGNQPYAGKLAVGIVVMNRKQSSKFPSTIKGVIYQKYQFGPARNGSLAAALARYESGRFVSSDQKESVKAAKAVLEGTRTVTYGGRSYNMNGYYYFSGRVSGYRLQIAHHQFK